MGGDQGEGQGGLSFRECLKRKATVITVELYPPRGTSVEKVLGYAELLRGRVDGLNITDNQRAMMRMAPMALCHLLWERGHHPILQLTCRDRNRLALQADLLGCYALNIENLCVMSGDHPLLGDHPQAKPVFDLDSLQLVALARHMAHEGRYLSGREIKPAPDLFVGATANPFAPPFDFRPLRLAKKVEAGAQFIQTQIIYNVDRFAAFMTRVRDLGLDRKVPILAGVAPLRSARGARYMRDRVPGMDVPLAVVRRMEQAGDVRSRREEEGLRICIEVIEQLRDIPGIAGFHLMPIHWEEAVAEIVERARLRVGSRGPASPTPEPDLARGTEAPVLKTQERTA